MQNGRSADHCSCRRWRKLWEFLTPDAPGQLIGCHSVPLTRFLHVRFPILAEIWQRFGPQSQLGRCIFEIWFWKTARFRKGRGRGLTVYYRTSFAIWTRTWRNYSVVSGGNLSRARWLITSKSQCRLGYDSPQRVFAWWKPSVPRLNALRTPLGRNG